MRAVQSALTVSQEPCFSVRICRLRAQSYRNLSPAHLHLHLKFTEAGRFCPKFSLSGIYVYAGIHSCSWVVKQKEMKCLQKQPKYQFTSSSDCREDQKIASLSISFQEAITSVKYWGTSCAKDVLSSAFILPDIRVCLKLENYKP